MHALWIIITCPSGCPWEIPKFKKSVCIYAYWLSEHCTSAVFLMSCWSIDRSGHFCGHHRPLRGHLDHWVYTDTTGHWSRNNQEWAKGCCQQAKWKFWCRLLHKRLYIRSNNDNNDNHVVVCELSSFASLKQFYKGLFCCAPDSINLCCHCLTCKHALIIFFFGVI